MAFGLISSLLLALYAFRLQILPFTLYLWLWACSFRFMFTPVRHSFALLIHKQLSRKATLFQDVLLFELFHKTYLILFYFYLNQLRNFPAKTYRSGKKRIALSQQPGRSKTLRISALIVRFPAGVLERPAATNQRAPWPENKLNHKIINIRA